MTQLFDVMLSMLKEATAQLSDMRSDYNLLKTKYASLESRVASLENNNSVPTKTNPTVSPFVNIDPSEPDNSVSDSQMDTSLSRPASPVNENNIDLNECAKDLQQMEGRFNSLERSINTICTAMNSFMGRLPDQSASLNLNQ